MPIQMQGANGTTIAEGGTTFAAAKTQSMPLDYGALGHYAYGGISGVIPAALAANSEIFQFRWSDATRLCAILEVAISASVSTTMFAAGVPVQIDMVKATSWTAAGTGGTRITPAALLKLRTSMGSTLVAASDIAIATTAALGAGTKTLETVALRALAAAGPITGSLNGSIIAPGTMLFCGQISDGQHPLVLAQNEGFVIRSVAVPATGTWTASISVTWAELTAF